MKHFIQDIFHHTTFQNFMEMARPLDSKLKPGYEVFVFRDKETGRIDKEKPVYVLGVAKEETEKAFFNDSGFKLKTNNKGVKEVVRALLLKGYEKIDHDKINKGRATYAGGKTHDSGVVEQWKGTVYHGTNDIDFFGEVYGRNDLGMGSHLGSLNGGDAFSVTTNIKIAKSFAFDSNRIGMVIEFEADFKVYYASIDEDDLDEIDLPDGVQAVAIPYADYMEDEFAVISWNDSDMLRVVAVHLPLENGANPKTKRYSADKSIAEYRGFWRAYASDWLQDIYSGDVDRMVHDRTKGAINARELEDGVIKAGSPAFFFGPLPALGQKPWFRWAGDGDPGDHDSDEYDEEWPIYHTVDEFLAKHEDSVDESVLGVHPLGYVLAPEAEQDYKALMREMPPGPKNLEHKKQSLFEGSGYIAKNGDMVDSKEIDHDRVRRGQVRYQMNDGLLKVEVGKRLSAAQVAKLRRLVGKASSVDLDVHSATHKDFEHYKKDRLEQVIPAISSFFDTNRLPPFQSLAPLRTDIQRLDQG